jgi:hypothetical protein
MSILSNINYRLMASLFHAKVISQFSFALVCFLTPASHLQMMIFLLFFSFSSKNAALAHCRRHRW